MERVFALSIVFAFHAVKYIYRTFVKDALRTLHLAMKPRRRDSNEPPDFSNNWISDR